VDYQIGIKLLLAVFLGGCIGVEREMRDKPAGLRTNVLICLGSTLFMSISVRMASVFGGDPTRIAAQIITGIGFLGAGAVLHSHGFVIGLTTAATIWLVAGIGMALGAGFYGTAVFTTLMGIITLTLLSFVERRIENKRVFNYTVIATNLDKALSSIKQALEEFSTLTPSFNFQRKDSHYRIWFNVMVSREQNLKIIEKLSHIDEITQVETGSSVQAFIQAVHPDH